MTPRRNRPRVRPALAIAAVAVLTVVLAGCGGGLSSSSSSPSSVSLSAGEQIFRTGKDASGRPIPRKVNQTGAGQTGGGMMASGSMMAGGMMVMGSGCATCHGLDGRGRSTARFIAPNITSSNLTNPKGMLQPDGTRGPTYVDSTLRRAVTQGIDPQGDHLAWPMPQWQLTDQEWADLLAYLKTLH